MATTLKRKFVFIVLCGGLIGTAAKSDEPGDEGILSGYSREAKEPDYQYGTLPAEPLDWNSISVSFGRGVVVLNDAHKALVVSQLNRLRGNGRVLKVNVIAWSDEAYPTTVGSSQSEEQVSLAEWRAAGIISFLRDQEKFSRIESVNMARHANPFAEFFSAGRRGN